MSSWGSYSSIFSLGHRAVRDLLNHPHIVEEKVDGSQFSFGIFPDVAEGLHLRVRSKGAQMLVDAPEKMFAKAVDTVKTIRHFLVPGWTYRGEYLAKPKHNTLAYDRHPTGHVIIFDIGTDDQVWLGPLEKRREAERIGLECVPLLHIDHTGGFTPLELLRNMIDTTTSCLGGQLIEGIVVKPTVELYGVDKKTLMGKFVSERFKEAHRHAWKETSPNSGDILERLAKTYTTEARWMKAIQHLREAGQLTDSPKDIGPLIQEVGKDLGQEEKEEIKRLLWKWAWPSVQRAVTRGLPEFYKNELLRRQFEDEAGGTPVAVETDRQSTDQTEESE